MAGLSWADYLVFAAMLAVSLGIGIYHSIRGQQGSTSDVLMGGGTLSLPPVILSMTASFISAILFLGYPAETFAYGSQYWLHPVGAAIGAVLATVVYVPVLYPLRLTSVNQYLWLRYKSVTIKIFGTVSSILTLTLYSATVYYGPSTALEGVTGFPTWASILIASAVSIMYTSLGGLRAVVWTDAFQAIIMFTGMLAVVIQACIEVGGFQNALEINRQWGRLNFLDFNPDFTRRINFWGLTVATGFNFMGIYGIAQMAVQRYSALPTLRLAKICTMSVIPGMTVLASLACMCGLVIFAFYAMKGCDPLAAGHIANSNQIMLYFASEALSYPGMPGLFLAAVWAGSLSSISSSLNSSAANAWEDILKPFFPNITEQKAANITKLIVFCFGVLATALSFWLANVGGTVVQIMNTFASTIMGPVSAVFFLSVFWPWVSWQGVISGSVLGVIMGTWVAMGSYANSKHVDPLPGPNFNCTRYPEMSTMSYYTTQSYSPPAER